MIYAVSDIHGCFEKYQELLKVINFCDDDTLYVLGDVVDRGEGGIKVLFDMMGRKNVIPIIGNHDYIAAKMLKKLSVEITEENVGTHLDISFMKDYLNWIADGGETTVAAFSKLSKDEKEEVLEYIIGFSPYEEVDVYGNHFILVHAGFMNFSIHRKLDDYDLFELIFERPDYSKVYFKDSFLVTGHSPTSLIDESSQGLIYKKNNHIAIDCGAVFWGKLGAICLDSMEEYYV